MPNTKFPTLGGHVFWTDLVCVNGWHLQRNNVFGNCRILDPDDIRKAWGGQDAMAVQIFEQVVAFG
jgi:hypothetical protein